MLNYKNGSTHYRDSRMMQVFEIDSFISYLHEHYSEYRVVEIGTAFGGLTNLICDYFGEIQSYDNKDYAVLYSEEAKGSFKQADCHDDAFLEEEFKSFLDDEKKTIFFIDGGDKAFEFNKIQKYAKSGDILMVHDYSVDSEDFQNRGQALWNCLEVQESDLHLNDFDRAPFFEKALQYAWGAYVKK